MFADQRDTRNPETVRKMDADGSTKRRKQPSDIIDQAKEEPAAKEGKVAAAAISEEPAAKEGTGSQECRKYERECYGRELAQT